MKTRISSELVTLYDENNEPYQERQNVEYPIDNAYILAWQPSTLLLSANAASVAINGVLTLSAQLRTPELADYSYQNLTDNITVRLKVGDNEVTANLINGFWTDTGSFTLAGTYEIRCLEDNYPSNTLLIGVS